MIPVSTPRRLDDLAAARRASQAQLEETQAALVAEQADETRDVYEAALRAAFADATFVCDSSVADIVRIHAKPPTFWHEANYRLTQLDVADIHLRVQVGDHDDWHRGSTPPVTIHVILGACPQCGTRLEADLGGTYTMAGRAVGALEVLATYRATDAVPPRLHDCPKSANTQTTSRAALRWVARLLGR